MKRFPFSRPMGGLCLSLGLLLPGCRSGHGGSDDASVRLINAAPRAQDLTVAVDGRRVWRHSLFRSNTGFQGVGAGTYRVDVDAQGSGGRLSAHNYLLCQKGKAYTVVAISPGQNADEAPGLRIYNEDKNPPVPRDKVRLRFINASSGLSGVDVLFNNIVGFAETPFGNRTQALLLDAGTYDVKLNAAGDVLPLVGPLNLYFLPGHAYTLVAMGRRDAANGAQGLSLEAYPDDH